MDQESLRTLLQRAEEIQNQREVQLSLTQADSAILDAAEEAGLDRSAVEQALRERFSLESRAIEPGDLVWVPSPDGFHRVATVTSTKEHVVEVRFLGGADHRVSQADIRPFTCLPGERVQAPWPNWGWWTCTVVSYDRELKMVRLTDNWSEERFSLADLRSDFRPKTPARQRFEAMKWKIGYAIGGGAIGAAITFLLSRIL